MMIPITIKYFVPCWGNGSQHNGGFTFDLTPSGFYNRSQIPMGQSAGNVEQMLVNCIVMFLDPLTAIGLGIVTPEELNYPPGVLAAFHMLRGTKQS